MNVLKTVGAGILGLSAILSAGGAMPHDKPEEAQSPAALEEVVEQETQGSSEPQDQPQGTPEDNLKKLYDIATNLYENLPENTPVELAEEMGKTYDLATRMYESGMQRQLGIVVDALIDHRIDAQEYKLRVIRPSEKTEKDEHGQQHTSYTLIVEAVDDNDNPTNILVRDSKTGEVQETNMLRVDIGAEQMITMFEAGREQIPEFIGYQTPGEGYQSPFPFKGFILMTPEEIAQERQDVPQEMAA